MLILPYAVENRTEAPIELYITNYSGNRPLNPYGKDTTITLDPGQAFTVAYKTGIGFPWERRKLIKSPNPCNFGVIKKDSVVSADCTAIRWLYHKGRALHPIHN